MRRRPGLKYQDVGKQVAVRRRDRVRLVKMAPEKKAGVSDAGLDMTAKAVPEMKTASRMLELES
jgi:hypothetical protein